MRIIIAEVYRFKCKTERCGFTAIPFERSAGVYLSRGVDDLCVFQKSLTAPVPEIRFRIGNPKPPTRGGLEGRIARAGDFNFHTPTHTRSDRTQSIRI